MGGSGSGFPYPSSSAEDFAKKIRDAEQEEKNQVYDIEINELLSKTLIKANERDADKINDYLNNIAKAIELGIEGTLNIRYGGSVAKHTYVDGLSDVDTLALINDTSLIGKTPTEVKNLFAEKIRTKYPNAEVTVGNLAVTIKYHDKSEIQILPAIKTTRGYKIQSAKSADDWSRINPETFAKALRSVNIKMQGKMIPIIKLVKSILSQLPDRRKMTGYHIEASAIEVFKHYNGPKNNKEMLKHFFEQSSKVVLNPIKDKTGQSAHVDGYLGNKNSIFRQLVSDSLSIISRRIQNADATSNSIFWRELLGR
ncbi:MAG TPA: nucleotidyltransferase [Ignavibacteriales bacterium]|nr:nucleotidyltransferase [Ignavibacteriales bacterium]